MQPNDASAIALEEGQDYFVSYGREGQWDILEDVTHRFVRQGD
jgi:uncharacterized cupin superfamily protein